MHTDLLLPGRGRSGPRPPPELPQTLHLDRGFTGPDRADSGLPGPRAAGGFCDRPLPAGRAVLGELGPKWQKNHEGVLRRRIHVGAGSVGTRGRERGRARRTGTGTPNLQGHSCTERQEDP